MGTSQSTCNVVNILVSLFYSFIIILVVVNITFVVDEVVVLDVSVAVCSIAVCYRNP